MIRIMLVRHGHTAWNAGPSDAHGVAGGPAGRFRGIIDLIQMKMLTFPDESQGSKVVAVDIPDEHADEAAIARETMLAAARGLEACRHFSTISKSSLPAPQSGQRHDRGTSAHAVPGSIPLSGSPFASS